MSISMGFFQQSAETQECGTFTARWQFHFYMLERNVAAFFRCFEALSPQPRNAFVSAAVFWFDIELSVGSMSGSNVFK